MKNIFLFEEKCERVLENGLIMSEEIDLNNAFENLLLAEDIAEQNGYEEGYKIGQNNSLHGYHIGYHKASIVAAKLGYYKGILAKNQRKSFSPKIHQQAKKLLDDIRMFPVYNNSSVEILNYFDSIKLNFNKLCSMSKITCTYSELDQLHF
ncbi:uncharacterized protein LOC117170551 isoform X3 [Belonocnema kinseyi]|uniref:uncharacterized protein LOC117170551 isoform X3 n=1 Tax=Belonocnema kinseyi TaxID=2817044 RepID=UPI00143DF49E|nr:uncharacterized protein LOC117170551 isoform X3 [Belonocnema kinseyi]